MRVTGTIVLKRPEKDGDIHIQLQLDKKFLPLLNATNKSRQGGNLVLEPICVGTVTQARQTPGALPLVDLPAQGESSDYPLPTGGFGLDERRLEHWIDGRTQ
jgi:hypothetical protein